MELSICVSIFIQNTRILELQFGTYLLDLEIAFMFVIFVTDMSDTAARLAEYRRKREEAEVQAKRSEAVWNAFTLAPLRRRLAATLAVDQEEQLDEREHEKEGEGEEEMLEEETSWTKLDWVILAVKVFNS